jgi:uncharacterized protein YqfA (UPF0365 family)
MANDEVVVELVVVVVLVVVVLVVVVVVRLWLQAVHAAVALPVAHAPPLLQQRATSAPKKSSLFKKINCLFET